MQDQRSADSSWLPDSDEVACVILGIVLRRNPGLVAVEELVRELAAPSLAHPIEEALIHDGLLDLTASGLIHRLDRFVFASRAATRAAELAV